MNISEQVEEGGVILERLGKRTIPAALKPHVAAFKAEYGGFEKATADAAGKRQKRDEALEAVGDLDSTLDVDVESLARAAAGADMGTRANPFRGLSKYSPGKLTRLPYATEAAEVVKLVAAIGKTKLPADVKAKAAKCKKSAEAVQSGLKALSHPQVEYSTALATRDALLPGCAKALRKLKTQAKAAWDDEPGVYEAVFAPPDKVQTPAKPQATKPKVTRKSNAAKKTAAKEATGG